MKVKCVFKDYVQKSRVFMYPTLGMKRGLSITPVGTYLSWAGKYTEDDHRFIMVYHIREDRDFKLFEDVKLKGHPLFEHFFHLDNGDGAYVFDFTSMKEDFSKVVKGQYSKLSDEHKKKILNFYANHPNDLVYIESYLYPAKYYPIYAQLLHCDIKALKDAVELYDKPDLVQECLKIKARVDMGVQIRISLQQ